MGNGMVRKVDELGRVVIPKEMRRILNIKTGSSIEMIIDDDNQVVLKKFSELENISSVIESLVKTIYDFYNIPCFVCDDDKILVVCGLPKKEFLYKKIRSLSNKKNQTTLKEVLEGVEDNSTCFVFSVITDGFDCGKLVLIGEMTNEQICSINVLVKFVCSILKF
ncbi:MAG: AbrB/MazE/SpoVT family DNA-binding domain-containing protein [Clostridia bacterium]|nr:AbrB/MazE/SpoVT family DNA-binding domain-containing protein [Clostridia bacterium]